MYSTPDERRRRIALVNTHELAPHVRGKNVYDAIAVVMNDKGFTKWDMICFCSHYLAMVISKETPMLYGLLKNLAAFIVEFHYFGEKWEWENERLSTDTSDKG